MYNANDVESPRWLLSQDRAEEALVVLEKIRPKQDIREGLVSIELTAMRDDYIYQLEGGKRKEYWSALFKGTNLRRTL